MPAESPRQREDILPSAGAGGRPASAEYTPAGIDGDTFAPTIDGEIPTVLTGRPAEENQPCAAVLRRFGDYELLEEIARGGMGVVYKARQTKLNRTVAVKMILAGQLASEEDVQRFYSEAEAAARLDHPGIVPIYDVGQHEVQHYFSMGYVDGTSLSKEVSAGPLPPREAARLVQQIAAAVQYAHDHSIVHRDLKPHNILLTSDRVPKVTDFGLAKTVEGDSGLTASGQVLGTPSYMPPEQAAGRTHAVGPLSDVYSLGAILYCLLTGRPPFQSASVMETLKQVIENPPVRPRVLNPALDRDLETVCLKCLEKDPKNRLQSAQELSDELGRYLRGEPLKSRRVGAITRAWRWCRRKPLAVALCASVLIAVGVLWLAVVLARTAAETGRLADLQGRFEAGLDGLDISAESLAELEAVVLQLEQIDAPQGQQARLRLHERFAEQTDAAIHQPKLQSSDVPRIEAALDLVRTRIPEREPFLRRALEGRLTEWQHLFELRPPFETAPDFFAAPVIAGSSGLRPQAKPAGEGAETDATPTLRLLTTQPSAHDVQLEVRFAAEWESASELGVILCADEKQPGYEFVLRVPTRSAGSQDHWVDASRTLGSARQSGSLFHAEIRRNGVPLQRQTFAPGELPSGPLSIRAQRQRGELLLQIGSLPPLKFRDAFPLSARQPGVFGLLWPAEVALVELVAAQKLRAASVSALEKGDDLYDQGRFAEALAFFRREALSTRDAEFRQEAQYKQGLCLLQLNRNDEAVALFEPLLVQEGSQWPALAGCQLWMSYLRQNRTAEAEAVFDVLSSRFQFEQLAALVSADVREEIVSSYLSEFNTIGRMLSYNPERIRNMERATAIDRFLSLDGRGAPMVQIELSRAYHYTGDLQKALEAAKEVAYSTRHTTAFRHYPRLLRINGDPWAALQEVNRFEELHFKDSEQPPLDLMLDRCCSYAALSNWHEMARELDEIALQTEELKRAGPQFASHYHLLRGHLHDARGERTAAVEEWRRGYRETRFLLRQFSDTTSMVVNILIMGSLCDELTVEDVQSFLRRAAPGGESSVLQVVQAMISPESGTAALRAMWQTPRGRDYARRFAFETLTMEHRARIPVLLAGVTFVRQQAFGGDISDEQEEVLWTTLEEMYEAAFERGELLTPQIVQLGLTWKGSTNVLGWQGVASTLPPPRRAGFAYVFAHRFLRRSDPTQARSFFETVLRDAAEGSELARLAATDLKLLEAGEGKLIVTSELPTSIRLSLRRDGSEVASLDVLATGEIDLAAGTYAIALPEGSGGLQLSPANITISPAERRIVRIESTPEESRP